MNPVIVLDQRPVVNERRGTEFLVRYNPDTAPTWVHADLLGNYSHAIALYKTEQHLKLMKKRNRRQDTGEYVVDRIIGKTLVDGQFYYQVKWEGYPLSAATWEPAEQLASLDAVVEYESRQNASDSSISDSSGDTDNSVFEVDSIRGHRVEGDTVYYQVHWKGYSSSEDTMIAEHDMECSELLSEYLTAHGITRKAS